MSGSELLLPDEMTLRGAGEAIAARMRTEDGVTCERNRIYYDTFDGLRARRRADCWRTPTGRCRWCRMTPGSWWPRSRCGRRPSRCSPATCRWARSARRCSRSSTSAPCCRSCTCTATSGCCPCSTASARPSSVSRSRRPARGLERRGRGAPAAAADHRHPRLRQATRPSAGAARRRARLQARRPAARRRGGQGHGRRARWPADEGRRAAQARPAVGRRRLRRVARDARGDRGEPRGHDRRPRHRIPARSAGVGATLALGPARAQASLPPGRARALPRGVPVAATGHWRRPRP